MGHRTLSFALLLRALCLNSEAFDELRDDDDPFVEGLFFLVLVGLVTAALALIGQVLAWGSTPRMEAIRDVVLGALQQQDWWASIASNPAAIEQFQRFWDLGWQVLPALFGAPDPARAALNLLIWPLWLLLSWWVYTLLAHLFARLLGGKGRLRGFLGASALSFAPLLLQGLHLFPFLALGAVLNTWQLILRYKAVRSAHGLPWQRAVAATLLPYLVYFLGWLLFGGIAGLIIPAVLRG